MSMSLLFFTLITLLSLYVDALAFRVPFISRRGALASAAVSLLVPSQAPASTTRYDDRTQVTLAIEQLGGVAGLIKAERWDSIRAVLLKPPLSDCWAKNSPFLKAYAEKLDDELAGLEAREDAVSHLRYLDMAAYNNVFNPIATEGTSGATKELVRSYYEVRGLGSAGEATAKSNISHCEMSRIQGTSSRRAWRH